jgi:hypothetical protein
MNGNTAAAAIYSLRRGVGLAQAAEHYGLGQSDIPDIEKQRDFYQQLAISGTPLLLERNFVQLAFTTLSSVPLYVDLVHIEEQDLGFIGGTIERICLGTPEIVEETPAKLCKLTERLEGKDWRFIASPSNGRLDGVFHPKLPPHPSNAVSFGAIVLHPWRSQWTILRGAYSRYRDDTKMFGASVTIENQERRIIWLDESVDQKLSDFIEGKAPRPTTRREPMWD